MAHLYQDAGVVKGQGLCSVIALDNAHPVAQLGRGVVRHDSGGLLWHLACVHKPWRRLHHTSPAWWLHVASCAVEQDCGKLNVPLFSFRAGPCHCLMRADDMANTAPPPNTALKIHIMHSSSTDGGDSSYCSATPRELDGCDSAPPVHWYLPFEGTKQTP